MTKSELITRLAEQNPHLYQRDVEKIVTTIFDEISEALARGQRVELRGFGAFSVKERSARVGRNPRTGEAVRVARKFIPFFKTGKAASREAEHRLNQSLPGRSTGRRRQPVRPVDRDAPVVRSPAAS